MVGKTAKHRLHLNAERKAFLVVHRPSLCLVARRHTGSGWLADPPCKCVRPTPTRITYLPLLRICSKSNHADIITSSVCAEISGTTAKKIHGHGQNDSVWRHVSHSAYIVFTRTTILPNLGTDYLSQCLVFGNGVVNGVEIAEVPLNIYDLRRVLGPVSSLSALSPDSPQARQRAFLPFLHGMTYSRKNVESRLGTAATSEDRYSLSQDGAVDGLNSGTQQRKRRHRYIGDGLRDIYPSSFSPRVRSGIFQALRCRTRRKLYRFQAVLYRPTQCQTAHLLSYSTEANPTLRAARVETLSTFCREPCSAYIRPPKRGVQRLTLTGDDGPGC
ncbi:uncharacterized protein EV422DRAFT_22611 [Fimicolochytrium jonesii]|uniref:uncharacterized protein n=1 Tax=Fimicolochytrium jonesii TaxID=1396493 RepID=UPI0022FEF743|nr:uncharacterized protein EV422DRAFT_22611 [Fimicolochytrium jonesii]KAI8827018.1 hypothetical protein EV422DRAFT_22611 [Fimicolochytrium jonesii]